MLQQFATVLWNMKCNLLFFTISLLNISQTQLWFYDIYVAPQNSCASRSNFNLSQYESLVFDF